MTDMLLELSRRGAARRAIEVLGLPLPLPRVLERAVGPWQARELAGRVVRVIGFSDGELADATTHGGAPQSAPVGRDALRDSTTHVGAQRAAMIRRDVLADSIARMLAEQSVSVSGATGSRTSAFRAASEAFGIPLSAADAALHAVLVDTTGLSHIDELRSWFTELQPFVRRIRASGRLIVLAAADSVVEALAETAAVAAALDGFVRSAAKELGRRGATANLIVVDRGAEQRAAAIARFFLSPRSAFITAQPVRASLLATSTPSQASDTAQASNTSPASNASQASMAPHAPMIPMGDPVGALDRKVALVTGAGRGIGEATARRLAEEGAHVICVDRPADEPAVAAVARSIGGSVVLADVAARETPAALAQHVRARHGHLDILVHNAGITRDRTFAKMSEAEWNAVIDINLRAVIEITRAMVGAEASVRDGRAGEWPLLRGGGRIVCLSSVAGIAGNVGQTNYAASKAGLIGYVRALASDLAPRGITVNAIAPGFIETRMTAAIPFTIREAGRRLAALGQGGLPVDVAEAITFLAQPCAVGITGAVLRVCGGALIGA